MTGYFWMNGIALFGVWAAGDISRKVEKNYEKLLLNCIHDALLWCVSLAKPLPNTCPTMRSLQWWDGWLNGQKLQRYPLRELQVWDIIIATVNKSE